MFSFHENPVKTSNRLPHSLVAEWNETSFREDVTRMMHVGRQQGRNHPAGTRQVRFHATSDCAARACSDVSTEVTAVNAPTCSDVPDA
ncbi:MAG TPA: hypothetical protein DDW52_07680 [Planctomycetaceae bacterium]|nr:hypothetical protein [Planctomycetaceae bacterium]